MDKKGGECMYIITGKEPVSEESNEYHTKWYDERMKRLITISM